MQPNRTDAPKRQFRVQWGGSGAFVPKNSDVISWHELSHLFGPFCIEFHKATKQSRMHPNSTNAPKRLYIVQWGGSGAFVVNVRRDFEARTFALVRPVLHRVS